MKEQREQYLKEAFKEIEDAIQNHINKVVISLNMGFSTDEKLIGKYAGYDNIFRPYAESVGKWSK